MKQSILVFIAMIIGFSCLAQSLDYQFIYEVNAEERPKNLDKAFTFITNSGPIISVGMRWR